MNRKKHIILLLLLVISVPAYSQLIAPNNVPEHNRAFTFGEKLTYKVKYNLYFNLNVGEVTFEVKEKPREINGNSCYHLVSIGRTYNFYDRFFKVRDRYESFISRDQLLPQLYMSNIHEGNYKKQEHVVFNHSNQTAKSLSRTHNIPNNTQDILSALYYARNIDFSKASPGDSFMIHTYLSDSTYFLGIRFAGRENIKTSHGKFNTIILHPILINDRVFKKEDDMTLWVSDDLNKIPLRIKSAISVGSVLAELDSFEGLKHTLTSRLK